MACGLLFFLKRVTPADHRPKMTSKLDVTADELERIKNAFANEEFRKLFREYAEELSDPKLREQYENDIQAMEATKGRDVKFVKPDPGFVFITFDSSKKKVVINVCMSDLIDKPTKVMSTKDGKSGVSLSLPHIANHGRSEVDKGGTSCTVFDVLFHPAALEEAQISKRFKQTLIDSAIDSVEKVAEMKLNREAVKLPKKRYFGTPKSVMMRRPNDEEKEVEEKPSERPANNGRASASDVPERGESERKPQYKIIHRGYVDYQDYTIGSTKGSRPKELVITIDLPECLSAKDLALDVTTNRLELECAAHDYRLDLKLPYAVDEESSSAKFDKKKRQLVVVLLVVSPEPPRQLEPMMTMKPALPEFTHWQDETSVTLVALVPNVREENVKMQVTPTTASLTFFGNSASDSYSLCVRTRLSPADDRFSPSDSKFHVVDGERLIVGLAKERTSCRLWNNIFVGESFDSLEEVLFLVDDHLPVAESQQENDEGNSAVLRPVVQSDNSENVVIEFAEKNEKRVDTETAERSSERKWPVTEFELQQEDAENDEGNRNGESEVKSVTPPPVSKSETPKDVELESEFIFDLDS